jgi:hypothetical protein
MCRKPGGVVSGDEAEREKQEQQREEAQTAGPSPIASACPGCGGEKYLEVRPNRWVTFTFDRVCDSCGTRYSPPTPAWAGVVFILVGIPPAGFGLVDGVLGALHGSLCPIVFDVLIFLLGAAAIVHGIRCLVTPGRV